MNSFHNHCIKRKKKISNETMDQKGLPKINPSESKVICWVSMVLLRFGGRLSISSNSSISKSFLERFMPLLKRIDESENKLELVTECDLTHYQMTNFRLFQTERVCRRQF